MKIILTMELLGGDVREVTEREEYVDIKEKVAVKISETLNIDIKYLDKVTLSKSPDRIEDHLYIQAFIEVPDLTFEEMINGREN